VVECANPTTTKKEKIAVLNKIMSHQKLQKHCVDNASAKNKTEAVISWSLLEMLFENQYHYKMNSSFIHDRQNKILFVGPCSFGVYILY
jgi:hypothetical protein